MPGGEWMGVIVGRVAQEAAVAAFLGGGSAPGGAMLIEGEAGIGKSTLWQSGLSLAAQRSMTVLSVRPAQAEAKMSFAGLSDLLERIADEVLPRLALPLRSVLEIALLRRVATRSPANEREIGAAVLAALRLLAVDDGVLIAVDDVQWLDRASAEVLAFALRRLDTELVWVLITRRSSDDHDAAGADDSARPAPVRATADADLVVDALGKGLQRLALGALTDAEILELFQDQQLRPYPGASERQLIAAARGNPYWAKELARAFRSAGGARAAGLLVPASLSSLLHSRLEQEPEDARAALRVVAALSSPTFASASRALLGAVADPEAAVDAAVTAGLIVETAGRLRPSHPLLGSHALQSLPPGQRHRLHRRLAEITADPEQRARHLALATDGEPDAHIAGVLEIGALSARSRGALHTAGELIDLAMTLTPRTDGTDLSRRRLLAADLHFAAGDLVRACEVAESMVAERPGRAQWPLILPILTELTYWVRGQAAAQELLRNILEDKGSDERCRAVALACAADVGDGRGSARADLARESIELFDRIGDTDPGALSMALVYLAEDHLDAGHGMAFDLLDRADAAEARQELAKPRGVPVLNRVRSVRAYQLKLVDDLDGARSELVHALMEARSEGDEGSFPALLGHLALTEYWAGDFRKALMHTGDGFEHISRSGGVAPATLYSAAALASIVTGDPARARTLIAGQLGDGGDAPTKKTVAYQHVLGLADLLDGSATAALEHLELAWSAIMALGLREPGRRQRMESDFGHALIAVGQLERAASLAAEQRDIGARLGRPTLLGVAYRLDGQIAAAGGDLDQAVILLECAVEAHRRSSLALELPRSQLALGQVHRRRRAKPLARASLRAAADGFTALGALPWAQLAETELDRMDGPRSGALLTPTEEKVAKLAGAGRNNREIAGELFLSSRTVEGHLASVYRKLGIRGRAELAHRRP